MYEYRSDLQKRFVDIPKSDLIPNIMFIGKTPEHDLIRNFFGSQDDTAGRLAIELTLKNCFSIPPLGTPYQDILEFKEKRTPELLRFQNKISELANVFVKHGDIEAGVKEATMQLDPILEDISKVMLETWRTRNLRSLKIELGNFSKNAIICGSLGCYFTKELTGLLLGAAAASIHTIVKKTISSPDLTTELNSYAYTIYAARQLN